MAALYVLDFALGHPFSGVKRLVDLDAEANIPTWYSSAQLLVLGLLLGVFAVVQLERGVPHAGALFALPILCVLMSCDEVAQIHEWLGGWSDVFLPRETREGTIFSVTGIWVFLFGPPFVAAVIVLWRRLAPFLKGRDRAIRLYVTGFVVYATSALGIELLSNFVVPGSVAAMVQVLCEEIGEMLGVTLAIWATLEFLDSYGIRIRRPESA